MELRTRYLLYVKFRSVEIGIASGECANDRSLDVCLHDGNRDASCCASFFGNTRAKLHHMDML
jgi:hypothetical protein